MDDLNLSAKSIDRIDSLVQTVYVFRGDIRMEFGLKKCGLLVLKRGKVVKMDGVTLPDGQARKQIDEDGYRYLGILELNSVKERERKMQLQREYKRRLMLKSKLNTRAVAVMRYGAGIIKWTDNELRTLDRKTRKILTMYGAFHPKSGCTWHGRKVGAD